MMNEPDILQHGEHLGKLVIVHEDKLKCIICQRELTDVANEEHGATIHGPCPVGDIVKSYRAMLVKSQGSPPPLSLPEKMPAQGVYTNMLTLLALSNVLERGAPESVEGRRLREAITGTLVQLCRQLKRHIPGRSIVDQALELLPDSATPPSAG